MNKFILFKNVYHLKTNYITILLMSEVTNQGIDLIKEMLTALNIKFNNIYR